MKNILKKYNLVIFIFLLSLIPVFWVSGEIIIAGGDDMPFLNPGAYFEFSMWNSGAYFNNFNTQIAHLFPFGFFWRLFQTIGFDNSIIQKIWLFVMWFIAGISITYLARTFFPKNYKIVSFFAVPFYFLNPFNVFIPLTLAIRHLHTFLPLLLAFFVRGIRSPRPRQRNLYAIYCGFAALLAAPAFSNLAAGPVLLILPALYLLFSLFTGQPSQIIRKIFFSIKALIVFIFFNFYWLWAIFYLMLFKGLETITRSLGAIFRTSSIFDIFRTLGGWAFGKSPYKVHEHVFYEDLRIVLASYLLVFLAFISFFYIKKYKSVLFFLIVTALSIFLIKGDLPPWKEIFLYLFKNVSLFKGYREPWAKFTPLLLVSLSTLFGFSCAKILERLAKLKSKVWPFAFSCFAASLLFIVGYPSIFGFNIKGHNMKANRAIKTMVPNYWYEMANWFNNQDSNGIVLVTPRNSSARDYMWKTGISSRIPLEYLFLKNPIRYSYYIDRPGIPNFEKFLLYFGNFYTMRSENFINYLNMLGIKYIVQENDIFWHFQNSGIYSPRTMHYVLSNKKYFEKIKQFGKIDIYKVKKGPYRPIIYPANQIVLIDGPAYAFSSWNQEERQNFSIISKADFNFEQKEGFKIAHQIVLEKIPPRKSEEETFCFNAPEEGQYAILINIWDNGKIDNIDLSYQINHDPLQKKSITIKRDLPFEKDLKTFGYKQTFHSIPLGKEDLAAGEHCLILKSPVFKNENFGGLNYITLNKYFSNPNLNYALPDMGIKKINSTKYLIKITNSENPYILNFAQNFDPDWKLYLLKNKKKYILTASHFTVNGVNNGWYIDPQSLEADSDYELLLEYAPQKILICSLIISGATILFSIIYVLKIKVKMKNNQHKKTAAK